MARCLAVEDSVAILTGEASTPRSPRFGEDWWRRGVVYQIYPRSFADTNADGVGDFAGIVEHLDHLGPDGLGVDAIWLSPIYPSPGRDVGYDVSDHARVDPLFGSEADFDRLVEEIHRRGMRIILDLVMNHTSDEHPWFVASRASRDGPYANWYIWRDPAGFGPDGQPLPPNNWVSWFGGSAWAYEPRRGQFYHHTFLPEQPELNWRTPGVEEAQFEMVKGWLARGVDGFRLDTFNVFLKHPETPSNPSLHGTSPWDRQEHRFDLDQPDLPALIQRFRAIVDRAGGRMSVGEMFVGTTEGAAALTTDRHLVFDWELLTRPWRAEAFRDAIRRREDAFDDGRWPTIVLSNHDQPRHASRLAASIGARETDIDAIAKAAATLLLTLRGTPFIYYGEEIAMADVAIPPEESVDPPASFVEEDFHWWDRSQSRTPLPWSADEGFGFTDAEPWLRFGPDSASRNVAAQSDDPGSVLTCYRRLIHARAGQPSLQDGTLELHDAGDPTVLAYSRRGSGPQVLVLIAFGPAPADARVPEPDSGGQWDAVVGTHGDAPRGLRAGSAIRLRPYEGLVLVADH
jgi:alpha-glucosidase